MSKIGYVRVSTVDQNTDRQLSDVALDKIFEDKASGKNTHRPQLQVMLDYIREGDEVFVHSMDRLARNVKDLLEIIEIIKNKGSKLTFVKEQMSFDPNTNENPMQTLMLTMLGAIAEFERKIILERQREGIAIAKTKGVYKGTKKVLSVTEVNLLKEIFNKKEMSVAELGRKFNISRASVYNYVRK